MLQVAIRLLLAGSDLFWELPLRCFGSPRRTLLPDNKRENPRRFRFIRVVRVKPSVSVASPSLSALWDGDIEALARMPHISALSGPPDLPKCLKGKELASEASPARGMP